jgi:hypothetical protein
MTEDGGLAAWAEASGRRANGHARGEPRFAFYGRVSTEDRQDPQSPGRRNIRRSARPAQRTSIVNATQNWVFCGPLGEMPRI